MPVDGHRFLAQKWDENEERKWTTGLDVERSVPAFDVAVRAYASVVAGPRGRRPHGVSNPGLTDVLDEQQQLRFRHAVNQLSECRHDVFGGQERQRQQFSESYSILRHINNKLFFKFHCFSFNKRN